MWVFPCRSECGLAAENVEKFPWVSRGKCGKVSVGGCQAATCGHLRPLEWLQVAASGCRWQENAGGHLRPLEWLQVAASGCRWQENAGGHLRPLAATRVAASGGKWLPVTREWWRPLAATCGHSSGCKWLPFPKSNYAPPACSMRFPINGNLDVQQFMPQ